MGKKVITSNDITIVNIRELFKNIFGKGLKNYMDFYDYLFEGINNQIEFSNSDYTHLSNRNSSTRSLSQPKHQKVIDYIKNEEVIKNLHDKIWHLLSEKINDIKEISDAFLNVFERSLIDSSNVYVNIKNILKNSSECGAVTIAIKWLIIDAFAFGHITEFEEYYNEDFNTCKITNNHTDIVEILNSNHISTFSSSDSCFFAEIPLKKMDVFYKVRREIVEEESDELIIAGETLMDALNNEQDTLSSLINSIRKAIENGIKKIKIYLADPDALNDDIPFQKALNDLNFALESLAAYLLTYVSKLKSRCKIHVYFLPFIDIDHVLISNKWMLYRLTKLWTKDRECKGSIYLYNLDKNKDELTGDVAALIKYFEYVDINSIEIDVSRVITEKAKGRTVHESLREKVRNLDLENCEIKLHKLYESQLRRYALSSFDDAYDLYLNIKNSTPIRNNNELFKYFKDNALDDTQKKLLDFLQTTSEMMNKVIKQYDSRTQSGAIIIPSYDLGYPNNVQRLAGGFATGMFIDWECGTPIIPIDATVNVCSSSVFKISVSKELLSNFVVTLEKTLNRISEETGFSFSFTSGNHFLMIANDKENKDDYYLVLHSSARELKNSYLGLYPAEKNWYKDKIKTLNYDNGRYLRYINGDDATYFIKMAHYMEEYNTEIHKKVAKELNNGIDPLEDERLIKHHYYMPTDSSIAIGTFVEKPGEKVPMFSDVGKEVYIFKIGENNLTYDLGEQKGRCCIIPHGWGQQIENIKEIKVNNKDDTLSLNDVTYEINSRTRLDDRVDKNIRQFANGHDFQKKCCKLDGEFIKTLIPKYLYCRLLKGPVEELK